MKNSKIKRMAAVALLMALVVVLQMLGGAIPPIGGFSISLVLIPIVLGAAAFGPGIGAFLGGTFAVVVYINCITGADAGGHMVFQSSPAMCFLVVMGKGILAGTAAGVVHRLLKDKSPLAAMVTASVVCPVVNTGTFILCMLVFFRDVLAAWAGGSHLLGYILSGLVLMNFVPELLINLVFSFAGQRILRAAKL